MSFSCLSEHLSLAEHIVAFVYLFFGLPRNRNSIWAKNVLQTRDWDMEGSTHIY